MSSGSDENTFTALRQFSTSIGLQEHIFSDSGLPLIEAGLQTLSRARQDETVGCNCYLPTLGGLCSRRKEEVKARRAQFRFSTGDNPADNQFPLDPRERFWPWLDDLEPRHRINDVFAGYEQNLAFTTSDSPREILALLRRILEGLDCWHPEDAVTDEEEE
ncbi:hypothetical protein DFH06DRAFT_1123919 [Mycena polygramma]|nr:hypothetical protein DFH06DRAFT_1123919 [Mycena polygramma]